MSAFEGIATGLATALAFHNLLFALAGCLCGTLIGVLPGVGPLATMAMLLPLTSYFPAESALIMLAGVYYGAQYGGSTTAILVNLPGESSSAITCLDGHQMARAGRAGVALAIAALASFFAGCVATIVIAGFADSLSRLAVSFKPADYFSLILFGLIGATALSAGSMLTSIASMLTGILLGCIGTDLYTGVQRFTLGIRPLASGIDFVCLAIGVFGLAEIIANLTRGAIDQTLLNRPVSGQWPTAQDWRRAWPATLRGTAIGSVLGVLPGGGASLGSFAAYAVERRIAKDSSRFGQGAIEGVAAPEAANNAAAQTSFIPMLTLGIPANAVMAVMIGALMIHGVVPGPDILVKRPEIAWGLIASMLVGNFMLLVINLPLVGVWVSLLRVPYRVMFPAIVLFCSVGAFSSGYSAFEVGLTAALAVIGFMLIWFGCSPASLALGFILGPMLEEQFRRAMVLSRGNPETFIAHPISATLLAACALLSISVLLPVLGRVRKQAFAGEPR